MDNIAQMLDSLSDEEYKSLRDTAQSLLGGAGHTHADADAGMGIDPEMLTKIARVMQAMRQDTDARSQLIGALKPYLSEPRRKRADDVMQMLRMLDILPMLGQL